jgi:translation initiation factor IF-3
VSSYVRGCLSGQPRFLLYHNNQNRYRRCVRIATAGKSKETEINEAIRDREVRLIGADGAQLGILSTREALAKAEEAGLDLVKIAPQATPPVCKILDFGKYRFEQQKKDKEAKKNQKVVDIKEVRLSLNIDTNDFNTKVNQAAKFLAAGHKVKASIRFRGREMAHTSLGADVLKNFANVLTNATSDKPPVLEGRTMTMLFTPVAGKSAANK